MGQQRQLFSLAGAIKLPGGCIIMAPQTSERTDGRTLVKDEEKKRTNRRGAASAAAVRPRRSSARQKEEEKDEEDSWKLVHLAR